MCREHQTNSERFIAYTRTKENIRIMAKFAFLFVLTVICAVGYAKHIHPKNTVHTDEDKANEDVVISTSFDDIPSEIVRHNLMLNHFVPVNDALFFMRNPPCEEGFERDVLGVCREVW